MKWLALMLIALSALCATSRAEANTTCSVTSITDLVFGAVDPTAGLVDTTATLNYSCTYTGTLGILFGSFITVCASLGPDDQGNYAPRTMIDASLDRMQYQVYKDAGRTTIWGTLGNASYTPLTFTKNIGILSNGAVVTGSVTVYGRVPALQSTLSPGTYTGTLSANSITYSYNEVLLNLGTYPSACDAGGTTAPKTAAAPTMTARATVAALCTFGTATDLSFGNVSGLLLANTDQNAILRVTCTNRAAYQLGINNGQNASGSIRRMALGTRYVNYELYRDSQRTLRWGSTLGTDTYAGTGSGGQQTVNVYGRVPVQAAAQAGMYSDIVTVTVTY